MIAYASETWAYVFDISYDDISPSDPPSKEFNTYIIHSLVKSFYDFNTYGLSVTSNQALIDEFYLQFQAKKYYQVSINGMNNITQEKLDTGTLPTTMTLRFVLFDYEQPASGGSKLNLDCTSSIMTMKATTGILRSTVYNFVFSGNGSGYTTCTINREGSVDKTSSVMLYNYYGLDTNSNLLVRSNFGIRSNYSSYQPPEGEGKLKVFILGESTSSNSGGETGEEDNRSLVVWSSWGNAVTTEGEYINVAYPASITYNLYTRGDSGHKYALAIRQYDENDEPGDIVYHCLIPVKEEMQAGKKYTIKQFFNTNALLRNLNKGQKYVLHCLDLTTSEYVGSVGFIPGSNVECLPTLPQGSMDSWWNEDSELGPGETPDAPPIGSADDIFQPPNLPNGEGGSGNSGNVDGTFEKIQKSVAGFFNGIANVFDTVADGLSQVTTSLSSSFQSLTGVGGQFKGFLSDIVPFIPPEIMALITVAIALSVAGMIIKMF